MIGLELTFDEHLANLVEVFREVRRVLRKDGTCWINYGDGFSRGDGRGGSGSGDKQASNAGSATVQPRAFLKPKDLMMMPARVAMALQADGWWLRSEIIYHKKNPMPESVTDRPTSAHEKLYLLTKSGQYFYDAEAVRVAQSVESIARRERARYGKPEVPPGQGDHTGLDRSAEGGANLRNVWSIPTFSYSEAHFATFPPALVEPCIKAGTSAHGVCGECGAPWVRETKTTHENPGNRRTNGDRSLSQRHETAGFAVRKEKRVETLGWSPSCDHDAPTVPAICLDPFAGSGTVGLVADRLQRDAILIEISPDYAAMARRRIEADAGGLFGSVVVDDTEKSAERLGGDADFDGLMGASE